MFPRSLLSCNTEYEKAVILAIAASTLAPSSLALEEKRRWGCVSSLHCRCTLYPEGGSGSNRGWWLIAGNGACVFSEHHTSIRGGASNAVVHPCSRHDSWAWKILQPVKICHKGLDKVWWTTIKREPVHLRATMRFCALWKSWGAFPMNKHSLPQDALVPRYMQDKDLLTN